MSLTRALGEPDDARLVVIAVNGIGTTTPRPSAATTRSGVASPPAAGCTSRPGRGARECRSPLRGEDLGVALTLIAEHDRFRWGPLTPSGSLVDGAGGFPTTVDDLWEHADPDEVRREARAQIERAIEWGIDVTHLDAHHDALHLRPELFDIELDLALEFGLPLRLPGADVERRAGFPFRALAAEEGVLTPDHVVDIGDRPTEELEAAILALAPGVTELRLFPALDTPEQRAACRDWARTVEHHQSLVGEPMLSAWLERTAPAASTIACCAAPSAAADPHCAAPSAAADPHCAAPGAAPDPDPGRSGGRRCW